MKVSLMNCNFKCYFQILQNKLHKEMRDDRKTLNEVYAEEKVHEEEIFDEDYEEDLDEPFHNDGLDLEKTRSK